jgi:TatD DNase family protein
MQLIDTHAHVNFAAFKDDADEVIKRAAEAGIGVINVGTQYTTSEKAVVMAHNYDEVWAAVGTHPVHLKEGSFEYADTEELDTQEIRTVGEEFDYDKYLSLARDDMVVAIGEIGLDYHHFEEGDDIAQLKKRQKEVLIEFIRLANEVGKPIIAHCWDGYPDLLEILTDNTVDKKGVIHSFNGGYKTAKKFIELGYKIGMNGIVTYSDAYHRLRKEIGLRDILVETDCPYLAPGLRKGERNEPILVREVAEKIAAVKDVSLQEVMDTTTINAVEVFNLRR